jgi:ribonuclease E
MAKGTGDFSGEDLRGWAKGGGGDGSGGAGGGGEGGDESDPDEGGEGGEGGEQAKKPVDVLKHVADEVDEGLAAMAGITLKDDEDKEFSKAWDEIEEEGKALSEKIREAVQAKEDLAEDDEDEDDEDEDDDEEDDDEDSTDDDDNGGSGSE